MFVAVPEAYSARTFQNVQAKLMLPA